MKNRSKFNIHTIKSLAKYLEFSEEFLLEVSKNHLSYYHFNPDVKIKGKRRDIYVSKRPLEKILNKINEKILDRYAFPPTFQGGMKGKSLKSNAEIHLGAAEIIKLDIKDFYPSITPEMVKKSFRKIGFSNECAALLSTLVTVQKPTPHLPQGFETSPKVSALVLLGFERELHRIASRYNWKYGIWADDLTISSKTKIRNFKNLLTRLIEKHGFKVNEKKLKILTRNGRLVVNSVLINKFPNVSKVKRNWIKQELYFLNKNGITNHLEKRGLPTSNHSVTKYKNKLLGNINFVKGINPKLANTYLEEFKKLNWPRN